MTEFRYRKSQQNFNWSPFFLAITTPTVIWMVLSYHTLVRSLSPPCAARPTLQALFNVQQNYNIQCLLYVSKKRPPSAPVRPSLMASSCSSVTLPLKCSISGRTDLSISISSSVGLSGKFEQLESPSSVYDLSDFTRSDESFVFLNFLKIQILFL